MLGRLLRNMAGIGRAKPAPAAAYAQRVNAAGVCKAEGDPARARRLLEEAAASEPGRYEAWYNLGILEFETWRLDESVEALEHALAAAPPDALRGIVMMLGLALERSGEWKRARVFLEDMAGAHEALASDCIRVSLLTWVADADSTAGASLAAHRRWALEFAPPAPPAPAPRSGTRRLRVGYVSGDLRTHPVSLFLEPVLEHHDRDAFDVVCYDNSGAPDAVTELLRRHPAEWRDISAVDDAACARRIREDGIDILVDLSGHTARNRLDVFALRPAPVQVTWLGYRTTTGLDAMDYRVTDAFVDPPGAAPAYAERLLTLPDSQWCYAPLGAAPEPGPLPLASTGHATFGSFNQFDKLNARVKQVWARLLAQCPGSRLLVAGVPEGRARERFLEEWAALGIDPARLDVHGYVTRARLQALHAQVDIALDCFPCNGATTTCESLWMGVPVVTLAGGWHVARAGVSVLGAAGLGDWIAADEDGYVALAAQKAAGPESLARLRAGMRARLAASPLMDGRRFTRALERAFADAYGVSLRNVSR